MHQCNICNKEFLNHRQLNGHKSIHKEGNRYNVPRKNKKQKISTKKKCCLNCYSCTTNSKFCSIKCQHSFSWNKIKIQIDNGNTMSYNSMRRYMKEEIECKCVKCGIGDKWNDEPLSLHLDHIDGNSDNNSLQNLRWLCPNCHSQTETWCGRNKKNHKRNIYLSRYKKRLKSQLDTAPLLHGDITRFDS